MDREPTNDEVTRANITYHDLLAGTYDERQELAHPRILELYRAMFEDQVFAHLACGPVAALDVGCGTGFLERFLLPRATVTGYDVSEGMLARARERFPGVDYRKGDAYVIFDQLLGRRFDVVCENALLHHLKDWEGVLVRLAGAVQRGGVLFLGYEPNALAFKILAPLRTIYRRLAPEARVKSITLARDAEIERLAEYHQFFTSGLWPARITRLLRDSGFAEVRVLYRAEHVLAQFRDRLGWDTIEWFPRTMLRLVGPLAPNFHVVAYR